jgi:hypothetical protein
MIGGGTVNPPARAPAQENRDELAALVRREAEVLRERKEAVASLERKVPICPVAGPFDRRRAPIRRSVRVD